MVEDGTITDAFLDWVRGRIVATGLIPSGCVFDEREKDLAWIIGSEVGSIGGLVCMIGLPGISKAEKAPSASGYNVSLTVVIRRCTVLDSTNSHKVAEQIFREFDGQRFYPGVASTEELTPNVSADSLRHTTRNDSDALHTMTLTYYEQL